MLFTYSLTILFVVYSLQGASSTPVGSDNLGIQNGDVAKPHVAPYAVMLLQKEINGQPGISQKCGASILTEEFILTAAHCVENTASLKIYLGYHNFRQPDNNSELITSYSYIKIHGGWTRTKGQQDDIALIHLSTPIVYNPDIQPVRLPAYSDIGDDFTGEDATAYGWGRDENQATSDVLRQVTVKVIDNQECSRSYVVKDTNLCTSGSGSKGTCKGDSGGPLVLSNGKLIGITQGSRCTKDMAAPRVFTRITKYLTWLETQAGVHIDP